jgi:hypothetical protein
MTEEEEAIAELKAMSKEELENVPHQTVWWLCCYKGCNNGTRVRDYGIAPEYWGKQEGFFNPNDRWILCGKHWKFFKRLKLHFSLEHIDRRIFHFGKRFIITDEEKKEATPKRSRKIKPEMKRRKT